MTHQWLRTMAYAMPALLLAACTASGPVLSEGVGAMRASVVQAKAGTAKAVADINAAKREDAIEEVLDSGGPPTEEAFQPIIKSDPAKRLDEAFDQLDAYMGALQDLVDPKRAAEATANLQAIGTALQSENIGAKLPKDAVAAFAAFGGAIVDAAAVHKAQAVMQRTDPAFQSLMRKLADIVAGNGEGTFTGMVTTQWQPQLDGIASDDFAAVKNGTREQRAAVVRAYAASLDARNARLDTLRSLRGSLLALGEAHAAAAKGNDGAVFYWIGQLNKRLNEARDAAGGR